MCMMISNTACPDTGPGPVEIVTAFGGQPHRMPQTRFCRLVKRLSRPAITSFLALFLLAMSAVTASAYTVEKNDDQVTGQIVISPTKIELNVDPGDKATREIKLTNRTGEPVTFQFSMEDFEGSTDPSQATVFMGRTDSPWGASKWIEPEVSSIVLDQGETLTMAVKLRVPPTAEPGGHYAVLFASRTIDRVEDGAAIKVTERVGTLFLITVSGNVITDGTLDEPEMRMFSEYGPVDIGLVFNNLGNVHVKPTGKVVIRNIFGQTVAEIPVEEWVVLPDSSRRTVIEWGGKYHFGRYTATAEIGYSENRSLLLAQTSFWVIPWKIVLAVLAGLVAILIFIILIRRRRTDDTQTRSQLEAELERLRAEKAGGGAAVPYLDGDDAGLTRGPAVPPGPPPVAAETHIALNEIFPSMEDTRVVDLNDPDTVKLVREMVYSELDMARAHIKEGHAAEARRNLLEARAAAQRIGLLSEIGPIDDMLKYLS